MSCQRATTSTLRAGGERWWRWAAANWWKPVTLTNVPPQLAAATTLWRTAAILLYQISPLRAEKYAQRGKQAVVVARTHNLPLIAGRGGGAEDLQCYHRVSARSRYL